MDDILVPYMVPDSGPFSIHRQPVERLYESKGFLKPGIIYTYIRRSDIGCRDVKPHQIYWLGISCDEYAAMGLSMSAADYRLAMTAPKHTKYGHKPVCIK